MRISDWISDVCSSDLSDDEFQRLFHPGDAGEAVRTAGAGDQPELDLVQAQPGARRRDPIMSGERDFEPTAQRRAVQRGDNRLRTRLDRVASLRQRWRLAGLRSRAHVGTPVTNAHIVCCLRLANKTQKEAKKHKL